MWFFIIVLIVLIVLIVFIVPGTPFQETGFDQFIIIVHCSLFASVATALTGKDKAHAKASSWVTNFAWCWFSHQRALASSLFSARHCVSCFASVVQRFGKVQPSFFDVENH
mmetsp:Transcript_20000/g.31774  ORF Transcript_20000/g.31774 Transcript_20000/m.31774 type:complete len:111 (+) Transcript_20000:449-781(+)